MELTHGGDIHGFAERHGREPLDFSASLNPLGMPAGVRKAARRAVALSAAYPDPLCRELRAALSRHTGIPAGCILPGNGAADLIYRLVQARRPRRALLPVPTFMEYERACLSQGCEPLFHQLRPERDFQPDDSFLDAIRPGVDMLFLCQPNNPTGRLWHPELLAAVADRCTATQTLLVADESFIGFVDQPHTHSLVSRVMANRFLCILVSLTKLYGMAGIRIGYCVTADEELVDAVRVAGPPWQVSTVAQAAGIAALEESGYVEDSLRVVHREKTRLRDKLDALGCQVRGDEANFLFLQTDHTALDAALAREGIAIRNCAAFTGLEPGYYRVAVRRRGDNDRLLRAIAKIRNEEPWPRQS